VARVLSATGVGSRLDKMDMCTQHKRDRYCTCNVTDRVLAIITCNIYDDLSYSKRLYTYNIDDEDTARSVVGKASLGKNDRTIPISLVCEVKGSSDDDSDHEEPISSILNLKEQVKVWHPPRDSKGRTSTTERRV
jgi:hypothetical protein